MYMLTQCASYPITPLDLGQVWVFLAVAYAVCWAIPVFAVWLGWGVGFQFYRRWRYARPAVEPIYLSLYGNLHLSLISFNHFCFLLHIRSSAWGTPHAIDLIPETCHFLVQLLPGLPPLATRASIASVLLIWHWRHEAGLETHSQHDPNFFVPDDSRLTPYAQDVILAFCAWVALRLVTVLLSGSTLLLFLTRPLGGVTSHSSEHLLRANRGATARDPAVSQFPAKSWRDENELQWAWRERTRARIQDAFELCIIRPTRSSINLEKLSIPQHQVPPKVHCRGTSVPPKVLSLDFAHLNRERECEPESPHHLPPESVARDKARAEAGPSRASVRKSKQSTVPGSLTFTEAFDSGMMSSDSFYGDIVELGALYGGELSPSALYRDIHFEPGMYRLSEEMEPSSSPEKSMRSATQRLPPSPPVPSPSSSELIDVPPISQSVISLPIASPFTPTFDKSVSTPHPLDAAAGAEQTFTASKGHVSFEVYRGPLNSFHPHDASTSFGSNVDSRFSLSNRTNSLCNATYPTFGTFGDSLTDPLTDPLAGVSLTIDDSFEVLDDGWSKDVIDEHTSEFQTREHGLHQSVLVDEHLSTVVERMPRGSAFFGDLPREEERPRSSTLCSQHSRAISPAFELESPPKASTRLSRAAAPRIFSAPPPALPPSSTSPGSPLRTPPRSKGLKPSTLSSPQDSSSHETINESELFYHAPSPSPRKRRGSTAAVGLRTSAITTAPEFGGLVDEPLKRHRSLSTSAPRLLPSPLLPPLDLSRPDTLTSGLLPSPMPYDEPAVPRDPDLDPTLPASDGSREATLKASPRTPRSFSTATNPRHEPPRRSNEHGPENTPIGSAASPTPSTPSTARPQAHAARHTEPAEFSPPRSLRQRRVPVPSLHIRPPPSSFAFPPPPEPDEDKSIPPPLPSSFSRGFRTRITRGTLPQWRDPDKTE